MKRRTFREALAIPLLFLLAPVLWAGEWAHYTAWRLVAWVEEDTW